MPHSILVIDDSSTVRAQLRRFLEENGFHVSEAPNGAAGLTQAESHKFDLVMVDINMPVMDGYEMVARLRKIDGYSKVPVFVLTTDAAGSSAKRGREVGATAWIVKPFNPPVLLEGIKKVLSLTTR